MSDSLIAHLSYGFIIPAKGKKYRKLLTADISKEQKSRIILSANQYDDEDYKFKYVPLYSLANALIDEDAPFEIKFSGNLWNGVAGAVACLKDPEIESFYTPQIITDLDFDSVNTEDVLELEKFQEKYFPDVEMGWILYPSIG